MLKITRSEGPLRVAAMIGIDPASEGLARAARVDVATSSAGLDGLLAVSEFDYIRVVFDAMSLRFTRGAGLPTVYLSGDNASMSGPIDVALWLQGCPAPDVFNASMRAR